MMQERPDRRYTVKIFLLAMLTPKFVGSGARNGGF